MIDRNKILLGVFIICIDLRSSRSSPQRHVFKTPPHEHQVSAGYFFRTAADVIKDTKQRILAVGHLRAENSGDAAFELGYLSFLSVERYRRMVDVYNSSLLRNQEMFPGVYYYTHPDQVHLMEDIEHYYWEIEHIVNMLHEIERKYGVSSAATSASSDHDSDRSPDDERHPKIGSGDLGDHTLPSKHSKAAKNTTKFTTKKRKRSTGHMSAAERELARIKAEKKRFDEKAYVSRYLYDKLNPTTSKSTRWWWDIEYGWEIDYWW